MSFEIPSGYINDNNNDDIVEIYEPIEHKELLKINNYYSKIMLIHKTQNYIHMVLLTKQYQKIIAGLKNKDDYQYFIKK